MAALPPPAYRQNVAIVVLNDAGLILACHRADVDGAWQLPQGGMDDGESPEIAMLRELEEEIGTSEVDVICRLDDPIAYEWPEHLYERGFRGQEQFYFLVRLRASAVIDLTKHHTQEFTETAWLGAKEFLSRVRGFKAAAYALAIERFCSLVPGKITP